ncbi:TRAP transporter substrate-binding protein [Acidimangrovimonas sediminis]|uniref:TRAP transporter substrate-binding protein n=1 Tax=Acidimangrovimonas sediminis TaxID=2056283 RepID=UPI000C802AB8|nr:TRAP transporter substrate-binding protein [Acidimangrovimonas sediminis]
MKSLLTCLSALSAAATVVAFAASGPARAETPSLPASGAKITIKTVTQTLPTLPQYTQVELPDYKAAKTWSHDRVTIQPSTWAEYGVKAADILPMVRQGQIDIGAAPLAQVAGQVPFLEIADLAGLSPDVATAKKVAEAVIGDSNAALGKFGIKIIGTYPFPANILFCKSRIGSLADLKGRKVRTFSASQNDLVTSLGAQTVSIGFPEVYGALQRGTADCAVTAALSGNAAKWYEVTHSMLNIPISWGTGGYYVSTKWWDSLDPPVQKFVADLYADISAKQWALAARGSVDGVACNTGNAAECKIGTLAPKSEEMTVTEPSKSDLALLKRTLADKVLPAWVSRCGKACATEFDKTVGPITGLKVTP